MLAATAALTLFPSSFFPAFFLRPPFLPLRHRRELVEGDNKERIKITHTHTHRREQAHSRGLMYAPRKLFLNRRLSPFLANGC